MKPSSKSCPFGLALSLALLGFWLSVGQCAAAGRVFAAPAFSAHFPAHLRHGRAALGHDGFRNRQNFANQQGNNAALNSGWPSGWLVMPTYAPDYSQGYSQDYSQDYSRDYSPDYTQGFGYGPPPMPGLLPWAEMRLSPHCVKPLVIDIAAPKPNRNLPRVVYGAPSACID